MKIELKLKSMQIHYLAAKLEILSIASVKEIINLPRERKAVYSILLPVADKMAKKHIEIQRSTHLFNDKKAHKISFKYHEAHALNLMLTYDVESDVRYAHIFNTINGMLDQKLL
ncbi:hypothetical protein [Flavobacterium sp.]|uniref:hypothetical protein n=1 Tax=Flavobacterium sp. TaxID=239 RepID=UPI0037527061